MCDEQFDPYQEYADEYGLDLDNDNDSEVVWLLSDPSMHDLAEEHGIEI